MFLLGWWLWKYVPFSMLPWGNGLNLMRIFFKGVEIHHQDFHLWSLFSSYVDRIFYFWRASTFLCGMYNRVLPCFTFFFQQTKTAEKKTSNKNRGNHPPQNKRHGWPSSPVIWWPRCTRIRPSSAWWKPYHCTFQSQGRWKPNISERSRKFLVFASAKKVVKRGQTLRPYGPDLNFFDGWMAVWRKFQIPEKVGVGPYKVKPTAKFPHHRVWNWMDFDFIWCVHIKRWTCQCQTQHVRPSQQSNNPIIMLHKSKFESRYVTDMSWLWTIIA